MDYIAERGWLFLGSRMKRLAERMQADVLTIASDAGIAVQPSQYPVLGLLDRHGDQVMGEIVRRLGISQPAVTRIVNKLAEMELVSVARSDSDRRQKLVSLTQRGREVMAVSRREVWPRVEAAVVALCGDLQGSLLDQIGAIETTLAERPLHAHRPPEPPPGLRIRRFEDALAHEFTAINTEWIEDMYAMEEVERRMLAAPRASYVEGGGSILFVEAPDLGIIGTCALRQTRPGWFELTKMGVRSSARGRKAGEFLLKAAIEEAHALDAETLYLLTNRKSQAAIHLYEKHGFVHDDAIMEEFGRTYERCNVAMRYVG
ncbi:bifunctional helix-turn-helix transcriptional regulator/GNAT family N-acetyltransferase [Stakelama tenebrarum]|uniref:GNAT family N-acetyltransferase n=1 Tax=Stakelama tenebrarum TaxID=2711215 RepID=A0A6G6Y983_9SPHN|nr:GNAT family N-acetyltransferase [Sphingosinithalassobacter tenebrarum]QIG81470.1 GNAT family N-acetyltransferase [Sphingosinithalassobacter tenebrarum]